MISSYNVAQFVKFRFSRSSKLINTIFPDETPLDNNSFLKDSKRADFPLRLIPVMTFITFWFLSCLNLLGYIIMEKSTADVCKQSFTTSIIE